jgi:heat shock protein HslJ
MARADIAWLWQGAALTVRLVSLVLLLLAMGCNAAPQPIEGFYRYGHEVNTVCTGVPETCYWLVDTDAEIRRQLKLQVADLEPYTPVCVKLLAQLSTQKADGFGLDYDGSISVQKLLGRCDTKGEAISVQSEDLRHHRWILHSGDGIKLDELARTRGFAVDAGLAKVPELDFGEQDFVAGNAGCNLFHGGARVVENSLILTLQASTEISCAGFSQELELELLLLYRAPLAISRDDNMLILQATDSELRYRLRDWVQ